MSLALREQALLFRQLHTLISASIPLDHCLHILEHTHQRSPLSQVINTIRTDIKTGKTLCSSLEKHPDFSLLTRQLIYIGEQTGKLEEILLTISHQLESTLSNHDKLLKMLFYPSILLLFCLFIFYIMLLFIVPQFIDLFANHQQALPYLTSCVFSLSTFCCQHAFFIPLFIASTSSYMLFCFRKKRPTLFNALLGRLPYLSHTLKYSLLTEFSQQLACTIEAGIPIIDALHLISHIHQHDELANATAALQYSLIQGWPIHHSLQSTSFFPPLFVQMVRIGEEAGKLDQMLYKISALYRVEVERRLHRLTQLLEPLIMLILGVLIGGLVIGMYLPLFNLGRIF